MNNQTEKVFEYDAMLYEDIKTELKQIGIARRKKKLPERQKVRVKNPEFDRCNRMQCRIEKQ